MTAVTLSRPSLPDHLAEATRPEAELGIDPGGQQDAAAGTPPLSLRLQLIRSVLVLIFVTSIVLLIQLSLISSMEASSAQGRAFDTFRGKLATGTAPIGPTDNDGHELPIGTSVAYLEIPSIGLKQVVGQGTTASAMFNGPGHRRDTPLPGQIGTSVVLGRRAAFGGPFSDIDELKKDAVIKVTTGQGVFNFRVVAKQGQGDSAPAPVAAGGARLLLVTAAGWPFMPDGVYRVFADLDGKAVVGPKPLVATSSLPSAENYMGTDARTLWALALWMQALIALSLGVVWAWHRWGRAQAWVVFFPPLILVGSLATGEVARLLPNLL